ncbi:MAG: hypothetical protein GVY24_05930 [Planctomycetes bacterium]|jgi:hypothetical protein|nr:hypothetical protein [Planctomycetota bacterium]
MMIAARTDRAWLCLWLAAVMAVPLLGVADDSSAQSLEQRIEQVRRERAADAPSREYEPPSPAERLRDVVDLVVVEDASARRAFEWWSTTTNIPLVIDWAALEDEGVDPDRKINLRLSDVPAGQLLGILMQQTSPQVELMYEVTPWYVQVMTKRQANQNLILRVYLVDDLVMEIPNFEGPTFDLNQALSNTNSGGSTTGSRGGGNNIGGGGLFPDDTGAEETGPTKEERGEALAQTVMDTVEPTLWVDVEGASVRYFDGRLIVHAPRYVHEQIGLPSASAGRRASATTPARRGVGDLDPIGGTAKPRPIASIQRN